MAQRKENEALIKVTLNLYASDWTWAQDTYTRSGASKAVRVALRKHKQETVKKQRAVREDAEGVEL